MPRARVLNDWHLGSGSITASRLRWLRGIALSTLVVASALGSRYGCTVFLRTGQLSYCSTLAVMVCVRFGGVFSGAIATGLGILAGIGASAALVS